MDCGELGAVAVFGGIGGRFDDAAVQIGSQQDAGGLATDGEGPAQSKTYKQYFTISG